MVWSFEIFYVSSDWFYSFITIAFLCTLNLFQLYEDGELVCFNFDSNSFSWNVHGSILITTRGASVCKACLHAGAIYWLENTGVANEFSLCYRTLPQGMSILY